MARAAESVRHSTRSGLVFWSRLAGVPFEVRCRSVIPYFFMFFVAALWVLCSKRHCGPESVHSRHLTLEGEHSSLTPLI